jgi:hypothetical protein
MPTQLLPDVYDITVLDEGNGRYRVFLVDGDVPTLVDAGPADTGDALANGADEVGITPDRLVITHRSWLGRIPNARITLKDSLTAQISRKSMH